MTIIQKGEPMSDLISRKAAIDALENDKAALDKIIKGMSAEDMLLKYYVAQHNQVSYDIDAIVQLPPIQPEIVNCKDCRKHNKKLGFDENYNLTYKDDACPLIPWRGMSKGHEHDYQSCCFGERREVTT